MSLDRDDIRAAVAAGMITEAQAASVIALADSRRGVRENLDGLDEPFELFKGFNEIFIVVGMTILYAGWLGVSGLSAGGQLFVSGGYAPYALAAMALIAWAARYFTIKRRMVAPSIALAVMFGLSALQLGASMGWTAKLGILERSAFTFGTATVALGLYYFLFRVPFVMALIALGIFATLAPLQVIGGARMPGLDDFFELTRDGPFAWVTVTLGLVGLGCALAFDMSDPHRVTRRSASGFWLHVVSAPAIVNTVALTLLGMGTSTAQFTLLLFLTGMALFAIVIDRRSFLVAGVGYVVALAIIVLEARAAMAILFLGFALVVLGAKWEALRGALMTALPDFPGKGRLPPWGITASQKVSA